MTDIYCSMTKTTEVNLKHFCENYPDFLAPNQGIKNKTERETYWDPNTDGELLLALINYAYNVGKNCLLMTKDNEFNCAEIFDHYTEKAYVGGSPKSMVGALLIVILNYHLDIAYSQ